MTLQINEKRNDIDVLRAIAIGLVLVFHYFSSSFPGGFIGVDVFFVISGYLITKIILIDIELDRFTYFNFYIRRINRLFPSLLVLFVFMIMIGYFVLLNTEYSDLLKHILASAFFFQNILLATEQGYFNGSSELKPMLHLWSLSVEMQFYVLWPVVLVNLKRSRFNILIISIIITLISFAISVSTYITNQQEMFFYLPHVRAWEFLFGSLLAIYQNATKKSNNLSLVGALQNVKFWMNALYITSLLTLLILSRYFDSGLTYPGYHALLPVALTVILIYSGEKAQIAHQLSKFKPLLWLGLISYPLYLLHWPFLSVLKMVEGGQISREIRVFAILISVLLSWLIYSNIEKKFRDGGKKKEHFYFLLILNSLILLGSAYLIYEFKNGMNTMVVRQKFAPAIEELWEKWPHKPLKMAECSAESNKLASFHFCVGNDIVKPEIIILGDSHSRQYYSAFTNSLSGHSVLNLGQPSCLPFSSEAHFRNEHCGRVVNDFFEFLDKHPSVTTIVLIGYWDYLASSGFGISNGNFRLPKTPTPADLRSFEENGNYFLKKLSKYNLNLIVMRNTPDLNFNIRDCYHVRQYSNAYLRSENTCGVIEMEYYARSAMQRGALENILENFPGIYIYDPLSYLCANGFCSASDHNTGFPLYWDSDHLSTYGAEILAKDFFSKAPLKIPN
jgi:peptidoglycan/LPS O-acetylase OafA/YrhL